MVKIIYITCFMMLSCQSIPKSPHSKQVNHGRSQIIHSRPGDPKEWNLNDMKPTKVRVLSSYLNVRDFPGMDGTIVARFKKGDILVVYEEEGDWYRIKGLRYISKHHVSLF